MPTEEHEILAKLAVGRPELIDELMREVFGTEVSPDGAPHVCSAEMNEVVPVELRADQVLLYRDSAEPRPGSERDSDDSAGVPVSVGATNAAVVVEVQRDRDNDKLFSWPSYVVLTRARYRCPTSLLVLCTKVDVARWAARPITINPDGFELTPRVIGPENAPYVTDPDEVRVSPERAALSVIMHGHEDGQRRTRIINAFAAGYGATAGHGEGAIAERHRGYLVGVEACLPEEARRILMTAMQNAGYGFVGVFDRYKNEGRAESAAKAVLAVLAARDLDVPDEVHERVMACSDLEMLDQLVTRAVGVSNAKELFDEVS